MKGGTNTQTSKLASKQAKKQKNEWKNEWRNQCTRKTLNLDRGLTLSIMSGPRTKWYISSWMYWAKSCTVFRWHVRVNSCHAQNTNKSSKRCSTSCIDSKNCGISWRSHTVTATSRHRYVLKGSSAKTCWSRSCLWTQLTLRKGSRYHRWHHPKFMPWMLVVLLQSVCKPLLATFPNGKQYHLVSPVKNLNTKNKVSRINQATPSKLWKVQSSKCSEFHGDSPAPLSRDYLQRRDPLVEASCEWKVCGRLLQSSKTSRAWYLNWSSLRWRKIVWPWEIDT